MVRLNALGQSSIEVGDVRLGPEQPYLFAIALYLIVERGKKIPRRVLIELIWPKVKDEKHARQRFRQALLRLREAGFPIAGDNGTLFVAKQHAEADFDLLSSPENIRPGQSFEFLPHYAPRISERFLDWVDTQRSRVHAGVQRVFLIRMQQARNRGDWAEVDDLATECLRLDPYNEEAVMAHAECAVMRGSKREALTILDTYMEALGTQVGTIGLPAKILRTRIAERLTDQRYAMISEQYFVGRESSMKMLLELLHHARQKSGSAAFIWGDPGIGKSRLVQEVTQVASMEGGRIVSTKCQPTDVGRPLSAFADLVPILKTLPGALGCSAQTLSLLQRLTDRSRNDTLPMQEAGDAAFLAATIRRAVFDLVDAVADEGLLVIVIEDVHWLDEPSWAILRAMVEWSTTRRILILMTSRTPHATERKSDDPDRGLHRHRLSPLADADAGTLLDRLTASDAHKVPSETRAWAVAAAEGNPYYLRELVRHWVETQRSFGVPRSLAELIEARLSRLSSLALRVLQVCAALGKHSTFERLEKTTGYQSHFLLDAIEELSTSVMLDTDSAVVSAKHDLLASASLNRLGEPARRLIHRQVAGVLEAEINEKHTTALAWSCAEHWQRAGDPIRALATVQLCAEHLHAVGQANEAIDLYEKAFRFGVPAEKKGEILLGLAGSLKAADQWEKLGELIQDATNGQYSDRITDQLYLVSIETRWRLRSEHLACVTDLVDYANEEKKEPRLRLQAIRLALLLCAEDLGEEQARRLMPLVRELESAADQPATVTEIRMIFETDFGDMDKALDHAHSLLALEPVMQEAGSRVRAWSNVATCYRCAGRIDEAKALFKKAYAFATQHSLDAHAARPAVTLAFIALQEEDFATAQYWLDQARKHATAINETMWVYSIEYVAARLGLQCGDSEPVFRFLSRSVARARTTRSTLCFAAIRSEFALASGETPDPIETDKITEHFEQHATLSMHDYFALSLYRTMVAIGHQPQADAMLKRFVQSQRRDRGPLLPSLKAAAAHLE